MIGYMSLEEQVDKDFERARRRSFMARMAARLRGDPGMGGMIPFEDSRRSAGADNRVYLGGRVVEVARVVGSVGRHREFDRDFMPTKASAERWKRVDRAFHRGIDLPPVTLYEIDGEYFVHDGNHRVSVAHYHGVEWIEAEVTRFRARVGGGAGAGDTLERQAA
ncbi:MAG TPA: hypothetical protein VHM16_04510 [Rubrobacteraceae bacterium]|nr:hypothetical protein [Rubrobacteraceae bacterium]